jgi:hypothetical protein
MEFESRAIRSLLELHEAELRAFLATWRRYARAGLPMPEAHGDEDYESIDRLGTHVLKAARNFLVAGRADEFVESILEAYRRHLASTTDAELDPQVHKTRLGRLMSVEMLLEHAVVHPMRHRVQLERILANGG